MIIDLIIIGGGAAGITAGIYASRAGMSNMIIEKTFLGGQIANTEWVENYTGFKSIAGYELVAKMQEHLKEFETQVLFEEIQSIEQERQYKKVVTNKGEHLARAVIITTGAKPKKLELLNQEIGGIAYCATCDGAFYRKQDVAVVGGGNTALEDAVFLAKLCNKVYLIHRRDAFRADKIVVDALKKFDNIELVLNATVEEIVGEDSLSSLIVKQNGKLRTLEVTGTFIAIGVDPESNFLPKDIKADNGYVITNDKMESSTKGIFAAGDVRSSPLKQVVTAVSDGAIAATYALSYINEVTWE